jgi:hypothetical protein
MFSVSINTAELVQAWVGVRAAVRAGVRKGVNRGVVEGADDAKSQHRFTNRSGDLEKSIVGKPTGNRTSVGASRGTNGARSRDFDSLTSNIDGAQFGVITAGMFYASFVEEGTRPHVILPKKGTWLAWEPVQGDWHFARKVNHPGGKPYPFMSLAYLKCERVMIREIQRGVADAQAILDR